MEGAGADNDDYELSVDSTGGDIVLPRRATLLKRVRTHPDRGAYDADGRIYVFPDAERAFAWIESDRDSVDVYVVMAPEVRFDDASYGDAVDPASEPPEVGDYVVLEASRRQQYQPMVRADGDVAFGDGDDIEEYVENTQETLRVGGVWYRWHGGGARHVPVALVTLERATIGAGP